MGKYHWGFWNKVSNLGRLDCITSGKNDLGNLVSILLVFSTRVDVT